nr:MAG TPA: hypothetical protein [Caudoviricetes sp.]
MAITPFEKDIEIIQKLDDEPNDVQGLTPEELKKRFDQAAIWLKEYINGTLIPAITGDGGTGGASNIGAAVDDFPGETVQEVLDAFNDALTDRYTKSETNSYVGQETENLVETVHVDLTTGVITVTKKDGSKETFDTALEKVPATMALVDEQGGTYLVITNVDGSQTKTDVSKLIDTYTFQNSAEVAFSVDGSGNNKTVTASIRPASIGPDRFTLEVTQKLEQYNATSKANADAAAASAQAAKASETNAKGSETAASGSASQSAQSAGAASGSASQAAQSAGAAAASAESAQSNAAQALAAKNAAEASATLSQSWTEGGTGIREGENTNNAKYWAGVAQGAAGGGVTTFNGRSGAVVPAEGDYTAKMVGAVAEPNGGKAGQVLTKTEDGTEWGDAPNAENAVTVPGGGTMQMGESLGDGPYTIEVTEDGEGGGISAEQVGYSNTGSGLEATNVQEAIDELAGKGGGEYLPLTGGTMTGPLTLSGLPTSENHAANKQYVDEQVEAYRAVKGTYPIAAGQSIQAGDVVDVVEGQLQKTVTAVPNVNTVVNKTAYAELQMVHLSKDINVQIYMNSRGGTMYANILDDNGGIVLKGQNLGMDMENIAAARLDDTHILVGFVLSGRLDIMVGTVSGKSISFKDSFGVDAAFNGYYAFATLPNGRVAVVYKAIIAGSSKLRVRVYTLSSSSLGSVYTRDVTGESQSYISAAAISEERVCICFADQNDNSKGKAVVAAINGSNVVSWGEVVTFCDQVGYDIRCCTVGEKVIATGYYNDTKLCLLGVTGNQITVLHNGNAITTSQTGAIAAISDNQAVFITAYAQESKAVVLTVNGNALDMGTEFDFARSTAIAFALTAVSNKRLLAAYEDIGNSNYGTVTTLTVSGNQIAGSFVDGSQDAIALQGGTAGQSIKVIYSGTVAADWVTEGQVITSPGVYGAGVLAGVLQVWSKERPVGTKIVTGSYVGTGTYGSGNRNRLVFPSQPKVIFISGALRESNNSFVRNGMAVMYSGVSDYVSTLGMTYASSAKNTNDATITWSGNEVSWWTSPSSSDASYTQYAQLNGNGITYHYTAIL